MENQAPQVGDTVMVFTPMGEHRRCVSTHSAFVPSLVLWVFVVKDLENNMRYTTTRDYVEVVK